MAPRGGPRVWALVGVFAASACTAVANGRLDGLPSEGSGGRGAGNPNGGEGAIARPDLKPVGTGCDESNPDECASGFCVDGVCCDQKCDGECVACDVFNQNGVCQALVGNTCNGGVCNADAECVPLEGGMCTDPGGCNSNFCADSVCCNEACDGPCESCADHTGDQATIPDGICAYAPTDDGLCGGAGCVGKGRCCGDEVPPTGNANNCPTAVCTGGCNGSTCVIACGADECKSTNITCPVGFDCLIQCDGHHACQGTAIDCPADHDCSLVCTNAADNHACEEVTFTCSNGPCSMSCSGNEPCKNADVLCGVNACDVACNLSAGNGPKVECGNACDCPGASPCN